MKFNTSKWILILKTKSYLEIKKLKGKRNDSKIVSEGFKIFNQGEKIFLTGKT